MGHKPSPTQHEGWVKQIKTTQNIRTNANMPIGYTGYRLLRTRKWIF